jgi:hypothetical protein
MSIANRLADARYLWKAGRVEGAFLNVLVATAAAARTVFPDEKSDRRAFELFVASTSRAKVAVEFRGQLHSIEHILYVWLRCELVHDGTIPLDIELVPDDDHDKLWVRAGGAPDYVLKLSYGWFHHLFRAVTVAIASASSLPLDS